MYFCLEDTDSYYEYRITQMLAKNILKTTFNLPATPVVCEKVTFCSLEKVSVMFSARC